MKKITLMIFVSLMSFFAHAQLAKYEFDEPWVVPGASQPASVAAPPDWVVINEFGPIYTWAQTIPGNTAQPPYGGTGHSAFLQKENVAPTAAIPSDWLITEEFPMIANAQVNFQSRLTIANDNGGVYKVYIAKFLPGEEVTVAKFTGSEGMLLTTYTELTLDPLQTSAWTAKTLAIPANALLWPVGGTVRVAFVMQGDDKDRWFLDDIQVNAICNAPTNPVVSATTTTTASLSWTNPGVTSWEIEVVPDSGVPTGVGQIYTGALPYVRTGLTPCTNYKFYVRAKCADGGTSDWVGPVFFKARCVGETCAEPLVIPPGNQSVTGNTSSFADFYEGVSGTGCGSTGNYLAGNDVVYSYTPSATGNYNVSLSGTNGPAGLFIYSSCANIGTACIGGGLASATAAFTIPSFSMTAGTTYYFVISTNGTPQTTPYTLSIQQVFCPPPTAGTATAVTGATATLGWTPGTVGATSWQMAVQPAGTGLPSTGNTVSSNTGNTVGGTTAGVPFTPATAYEFYVRESCGGGQYSIWAGPFLFTTTQVAATLNFSQNFDSGAHGFTLANGTQNNKWIVGSATSNSPSNSLYISNDGAANTYTLTTASVVHAYRDIQMPAAVGQLALSFDWKAFGESGWDYIRVWMVPASFTPTTGTQITAAADRMQIGGNFGLSGTWTTSTNIITAPAAWNSQTMRLVFEWRNDTSGGSQPPAAIDNINLSIVTCPQPTALTVGSLTTTNAVINWTAPAIVPAQGYDVYWSNTPTPVPTATTPPNQVSVPGTTTNIPLVADTFYYVWVRAHCSGTDQSFWTGPVSFSTPQVPAAMDYVQNFDSGTPHGFTLSNGTQVNKWFVGGATFNSASNSLYITNDNGVTNAYEPNTQAVVHAYRDISIPAAVPSGQALLQFDWKALANTGDYMRVWVVPITFTPTQGTQITAAASGGVQVGGNFQGNPAWTTSNNVVTIPAGWLNAPRRIVFEWFNNAFTGNNPPVAVDNINFKVITCPAPTALTLGAVTTNTATFTWTAPTAAPANYDVYYSTNATPPTDATAPNGGTPTAPTATISGLPDSTNFNVWVRSNCGGAGTSFWIGPVNFNTTQIPAVMPYSQNFDGATHGFALSNGTQTNKWYVGTATFNSAPNSLYVSNDGGVTNSFNMTTTSVVHAYRDIQLPATIPSGQVLLKFDWKAQGESTFDYIRAWIVPTTFTPTTGTQITAAASGGTQVGGNYNLNGGTTWTTATNVITAPAAWNGTTRRIVFEWRNDGSGGTLPPGAIDNIEFSVITCPAPSALVLGSVTTTSAVVNWTAPTSVPGDGYDFYYSTSATPPTAATIPNGNVSGTTATLSPLTDSTNYNVWVRSNCVDADGNSFWIGPLNFTTPQIPATMPYTQTFDGTDNPAYTLNNGTQVNKWVVGTATFNSPTKSLYISNDNGLTNNYDVNALSVVHAYRDIQLPASIPTNQVTFSYDWKALGESCCDYLRVWVVPITFTPVVGTQITAAADRVQLGGNLNGTTEWTSVENVLNTTGQQGTIRRIVFEWRNDGSIGPVPGAAVDNISLKVLTCPKPTNLTASNIGMTSATLGWTEAGSATAWEVYVVPVNDPAPTDATDGVDADSATFLYEDLEPGTLYKYYVRAVCGPGDLSRWAGPFNFNTNVCEVIDQCPVSFVMTDTGNGWNGNTVTILQNNIPVTTIGSTFTSGAGPVTVTVMLCSGTPYDVRWNAGGTGDIGLAVVNPFNNQTVFSKLPGSGDSEKTTVIYEGMPYCEAITCPEPTELVSESVVNAPNTTQLSWTPGGAETQWELIIQTQGTGFPSETPAAGTSIIVDEPFYVMPNLVEGQLYEFYVRAICGPDDASFWSGELRFSLFNPPACADVVVTDDDLDIIVPDTEYVVCPGEDVCIDFDASFYVDAAETTSYEITQIPFEPPFPTLGGTQMNVDIDDSWAPKITLPFEFCFFGQVYNQAQVGANGAVSFNANYAANVGGTMPWSFNQTLPNTGFPIKNAIFGVYQDTDPSVNNAFAHPNVNYQVLGNYPCRALVVSYNELAQFSGACNSDATIGAQSSQIIIYEITNIIEVYVKRRVPCPSWQNGAGVIGLINAAGDVAFTPPGRNTGNWTAIEEAWRFTPNGTVSTVQFEWLKDGAQFSTDTAINVCAAVGTTVMTARASYLLCNGENIVRESSFTIRVEEQIIPAADPVNITKCGNGEDVTFDLNVATADVFADPTGYNFTYYPTEQDAIDNTNAIATPEAFVTNATTTVWVRIMKDDLPCFITRSFIVEVANVAPIFGITPDVSICDGTSTTIAVVPDPSEDLTGATYSWTLDGNALPDTTDTITVTAGGSYVVTVNKNGCVGTATSVVTVVPMPVADAPADVTACDTYVLPALSADNNYYTGPGGTGTPLAAGEDVGTVLGVGAHTIYVYAVSPTLAACTVENTFVVTINQTPTIEYPAADVSVCDSYVLETLPANENYFTGAAGTGTALSAGDVISATQTIYVYEETATNPNCTAETSFTVTVTPTPVADAPGDVTVCDTYTLPALSAGNNYYTGPGGTGTSLSAGDPITSTQLIYVYAVAAGNANCTDENAFTVNVTPTPQFNLGGPYVACLATNVTVRVNAANFNIGEATYVWTVNGAPAGGNSYEISGTEFGTYEVTVTVGTCSHTESIQVSQDTTIIDLDITDSCETNVYTVMVSDVNGSFNPDTASYSWTGPEGFSSTERSIVPVELGEYVVTVTTADGCISIDSFVVTSTACSIPKGISPNNDGYNDAFDLSTLDVKKLSIFNRYGQEVYNRNNYKKEWIGQANNGDELPTGTYFYMVERATGETLTGWVYINRQD